MLIKKFTNLHFSHTIITNQRKNSVIHYHDDYELYYLVKGTTKYFIGDKIFFVESGNFVIIPPNTYHMTDSETCLHNDRILISFSGSTINKKIHHILDYLCHQNIIILPQTKLEAAIDIIKKIEKEDKTNDENSSFLIDLYSQELLIYLFRFHSNYFPHLSETEKIINGISKYIRENYNTNISLQSLSQKFNLSNSHLSRQFKEITGIGLNEYITHVRIINAEELLKNTTLSITEIAHQCGFNDSNYFSTVFKRIKGITPLKFSHKHKG